MVTQINFNTGKDFAGNAFTPLPIEFDSLSDSGNVIFSANPPLYLRDLSVSLTATSPSTIDLNGDYIRVNFAITTTTGSVTVYAIPISWAPGENSVTKYGNITKILNIPNVTNVAYTLTADEGGTFTNIRGIISNTQV